jgi:hypothetical protein
MNRPESKYAWKTNHLKWIEYADWLEGERDKLREAFMQSSEDHADTGKYALGLRKKLVERDEENVKLRGALESMAMVLCNPEGKCCIDGSDADRAVIDLAMTALEASDG